MFLAPFFNLAISAWYAHVSPWIYAKYEISIIGLWPFFVKQFAGHFVMAFSLYYMRPWSLVLCTLATFWFLHNTSSIFDSYTSPYVKILIFGSYLVNASILAYFLFPNQRNLFLNRRLRWWESKPRYLINTNGLLVSHNNSEKIKVTDISINAAIIEGTRLKQYKLGDFISFSFIYNKNDYSFTGKVISKNLTTNGYGIRFHDLGKISNYKLKNLIAELENNDSIQRKPERIKNKFKGYIPLIIKEDNVIPFVNKKLVKTKSKTAATRKKSIKTKKAA